MKCGRCGADVMLGSAQCAKCGASLLDATMPDEQSSGRSMFGDGWTPPETPEPAVPAAMSVAAPTAPPPPPSDLGVPPPPPPPPPSDLGVPPPPPPPPPTLTPAPPQLRPPVVVERSRRSKQPGQAAKASVGCGCLGPLLFIAIIGGVVAWGSQTWFDDVRDAFDAGSGERLTAPAVSVGEEVEFEVGSDDTAVHPLRATETGSAEVYVDAVGDFDPMVRVVAVGGAVLGSDDDGGDDHDSRLTVALTEGQDYEIEVEGFSGDDGEYVLTVTSNLVDGAPIGRASQVEGSLGDGETARHPFTGPGGELTVRVLGQESFDPVLTIRDSTGAELGTNDDADGTDSRLTLNVPLDASITIEVTEFGGDGGDYTVVVD